MVDAAQDEDVRRRMADADELIEAGRYDAARESLDIPKGLFEAEAFERLVQHRGKVERRIRADRVKAAKRTDAEAREIMAAAPSFSRQQS